MTYDQDKQLLADYLSGRHDALEKIDSWIVRIVRSRAWRWDPPADDVIQDCRLSVHQALSNESFEGRSPLRNYVSAIAGNVCLTWIRKKYRRPPVVSIDAVPDPPDPRGGPLDDLIREENKELKLRVADAIMNLATPECRDVWRMIYYEGRLYEDVAAVLGIEEGTVKSRVSRCKEKARIALRMVAKDLGLDVIENLEL